MSRVASQITAADVREVSADGSVLSRKILHAAGWTISSSLVMQVVRVASGLLVARLLSPHDYGLAGMALVFSTLVFAISDLSLGAALVQRERITEVDRSTVFWTSLGIGILLTASGVALSGMLARFYGQPTVRPLFVAISFTFVLMSLQTTQAALLQRKLDFRAIGYRVSLATICGCGIAIAAAAAGLGAWALIAQQLVVAGVSTAFLWVKADWHPHLVYSRASLRDLGGFGLNVFGGRALSYISGNVDNILIGRSLGTVALGAYSLAYNVMLIPLVRLTRPIKDVTFPALAEVRDDSARFIQIWFTTSRALAAAVAAPMLGLIVIAPDLVRVVLGAHWQPATRVIQILATAAILQSVGDPTDVFMALGRSRRMLVMALVDAVAVVAAVVMGLHWGVVGVAICFAVAQVPLRILAVGLATSAAGVPIRSFFANLAGVGESAAAMLLCVLVAHEMLVRVAAPALARLSLCIALGAAVYVGACRWREPELVLQLRTLVTRRKGGPPVEATGASA